MSFVSLGISKSEKHVCVQISEHVWSRWSWVKGPQDASDSFSFSLQAFEDSDQGFLYFPHTWLNGKDPNINHSVTCAQIFFGADGSGLPLSPAAVIYFPSLRVAFFFLLLVCGCLFVAAHVQITH